MPAPCARQNCSGVFLQKENETMLCTGDQSVDQLPAQKFAFTRRNYGYDGPELTALRFVGAKCIRESEIFLRSGACHIKFETRKSGAQIEWAPSYQNADNRRAKSVRRIRFDHLGQIFQHLPEPRSHRLLRSCSLLA